MAQHHEKRTPPTGAPTRRTGVSPTPFPADDLARLRSGTHHDPHSVFGAHPDGDGTVVRTMQPGAVHVEILLDDRAVPMTPVGEGLFHAALTEGEVPDYRYRVTYPDGRSQIGRAHV